MSWHDRYLAAVRARFDAAIDEAFTPARLAVERGRQFTEALTTGYTTFDLELMREEWEQWEAWLQTDPQSMSHNYRYHDSLGFFEPAIVYSPLDPEQIRAAGEVHTQIGDQSMSEHIHPDQTTWPDIPPLLTPEFPQFHAKKRAERIMELLTGSAEIPEWWDEMVTAVEVARHVGCDRGRVEDAVEAAKTGRPVSWRQMFRA